MLRLVLAAALAAAALAAPAPAAAQGHAEEMSCVHDGIPPLQLRAIGREWSGEVPGTRESLLALIAQADPALAACAARFGWNEELRDAALAYTLDRAGLEARRAGLPARLANGTIEDVLMRLPSADSGALSRDGGAELDDAAFQALLARVGAKLAEAGVADEDRFTAIRYMVSYNDNMSSMLRLGALLDQPRR